MLYELLAPYDDHVAISYPEVSIGAVALRLGVLAATIGRGDDAGGTSRTRSRCTTGSARARGTPAPSARRPACSVRD